MSTFQYRLQLTSTSSRLTAAGHVTTAGHVTETGARTTVARCACRRLVVAAAPAASVQVTGLPVQVTLQVTCLYR